MTAPPFIQVVVAEIHTYGPAAAIVLAHIRYRCHTEGPGRIHRAGHRWWRVSQKDLSIEVGLSIKTVRKSLKDLQRSAIRANHFAPFNDQSLA